MRTEEIAVSIRKSSAGPSPSGIDEDNANLRREQRSSTIRTARLAFGEGAAPGVLMDYSATGARVFVRSKNGIDPMLPDKVTLELNDGTALPALIRWKRDGYVGLEFIGAADANAARLAGARSVTELLDSADLAKALRLLSERAWFGDPQLGDAARALEQDLAKVRARLAQILDRRD